MKIKHCIKKKLVNFKALQKKPAVSVEKFIIYKSVYITTHLVIIIVSYLALIRLLFAELGFSQIKREYILYHIPLYLSTVGLSINQFIL